FGGFRAGARLGVYAAGLRGAMRHADIVHVMANSGWAWHLSAAPAIWAARLARVPIVLNYRGGGAEAFFTRSFRWVRPTLTRADAVVVPSGFLEDVFRRRGIAARIVPNVVDLERFRPGPPRAAGSAPRLVVARNLEPIYDIPVALRAFAALRRSFPQAQLTVAGAGPLAAELHRLVEELAIAEAVRFTGTLDNVRVADLYRDADLVLNP